MENITEAEWKYAKSTWEDFELQNQDQFHDLYVQRDTIFLADIFENFKKKCLEI